MSSEKKYEEFAEKVAQFCTENGLKAMLRALVTNSRVKEEKNIKINALHFPSMSNLTKAKKKAFEGQKKPPFQNTKTESNGLVQTLLKNPAPKPTKKISIDLLFRAKPLSKGYKSLYGAAFDTHKCCRNQDLHLYKQKEIFEEKRLSLKDIKGWKLPKSLIAKKQLDYYVDQIQTYKGRNSPSHKIKMIVVGEEDKRRHDEERRIKEHLELEKQLKEKRNYINQKALFN